MGLYMVSIFRWYTTSISCFGLRLLWSLLWRYPNLLRRCEDFYFQGDYIRFVVIQKWFGFGLRYFALVRLGFVSVWWNFVIFEPATPVWTFSPVLFSSSSALSTMHLDFPCIFLFLIWKYPNGGYVWPPYADQRHVALWLMIIWELHEFMPRASWTTR